MEFSEVQAATRLAYIGSFIPFFKDAVTLFITLASEGTIHAVGTRPSRVGGRETDGQGGLT